MGSALRKEYVRVWKKTCTGWLGWSEERFGRFLRAFNAKLAAEKGEIWFGHGRPFEYVIPLLVSDPFEEYLHHKVRKFKYGTPEWVYFESELLDAIEGGRGHSGLDHGKGFNWREARKRAEEHLALYREKFPSPETVTNYEKWILTFSPDPGS